MAPGAGFGIAGDAMCAGGGVEGGGRGGSGEMGVDTAAAEECGKTMARAAGEGDDGGEADEVEEVSSRGGKGCLRDTLGGEQGAAGEGYNGQRGCGGEGGACDGDESGCERGMEGEEGGVKVGDGGDRCLDAREEEAADTNTAGMVGEEAAAVAAAEEEEEEGRDVTGGLLSGLKQAEGDQDEDEQVLHRGEREDSPEIADGGWEAGGDEVEDEQGGSGSARAEGVAQQADGVGGDGGGGGSGEDEEDEGSEEAEAREAGKGHVVNRWGVRGRSWAAEIASLAQERGEGDAASEGEQVGEGGRAVVDGPVKSARRLSASPTSDSSRCKVQRLCNMSTLLMAGLVRAGVAVLRVERSVVGRH